MQEPIKEVNEDNWHTQLDQMFSKYVAVWIWSVIFGANTGSLYFVTTYRSYEWKSGNLVLVPFILLAGTFAMSSVLSLLRYLERVLLPVFFGGRSSLLKEHPEDARLLGRSVRFLVYSYATILMLTTVQLTLGALR